MSDTHPHKVILVDDHTIVRRGVAALLEMEGGYAVVAEAENGEVLLRRIDDVQADLLIMDLSMPRLNGIETTRRIARRCPSMKVLILSMYDDDAFVRQALQAGAHGYILKQSIEDELFQAIETIMAGDRFVSSGLALSPQALQTDSTPEALLTSREHEILQLIVEGYNTTEIAGLLSISPHTASRHRANLMQKLDTHTQAGLVRKAIEQKLVVLKKPPHQ